MITEMSAYTRVEQQPDHELNRYNPEHADKPGQRDQGVDDDEQVPEDVRGEQLHIFSNALIGVVDRLGAAQAVVDVVGEVALYQMFRHPCRHASDSRSPVLSGRTPSPVLPGQRRQVSP